jgi:hypothetical protein
MIKIPDISKTPSLQDAQKGYDELVAREKRLSAKAHELRQKQANGLGPDEQQAQIVLVMTGQELPDLEAEFKSTMRQWRVVADAKDHQRKLVDLQNKKAGKALCESLRPEHDKLQKRLSAALTDAHAVWTELFALKRGLLGQGIGLSNLFSADPQEFMGVPSDRASEFSEFMRDAARAGYCRELPR